jgi:hypothetical protein
LSAFFGFIDEYRAGDGQMLSKRWTLLSRLRDSMTPH